MAPNAKPQACGQMEAEGQDTRGRQNTYRAGVIRFNFCKRRARCQRPAQDGLLVTWICPGMRAYLPNPLAYAPHNRQLRHLFFRFCKSWFLNPHSRVGEQVGASLLARSLRAHPIGLFNKRPIGCDWPPIRRRRFPCGRERPRVPYRAISPHDAQNTCSPSSHLARSSTRTPSRV